MKLLLEEYVENPDVGEACACLRELKVPYYHHEAVKQALTLAVERPPAHRPPLVELLRHFYETGAIGSAQLQLGFERTAVCHRPPHTFLLLGEMIHNQSWQVYIEEHLKLDVPGASEVLRDVLRQCRDDGLPLGAIEC